MFSSLISLSNSTKQEDISSTEIENLNKMDKTTVDNENDNLSELEQIAEEKEQFDNHNRYYEDCKELSAEFINRNYLECRESSLFLLDIWSDEHNVKIEDVEALYIYDNTKYQEYSEFMITDRKLAQNVLSNIKINPPQTGIFVRPNYKWNFIISIYTKNHIYNARESRQNEYEDIFTVSPRF